MTGRLLSACGYASETGAELTPYTAQLWLTRFILLKQTQQFELLENELFAFGRLDNPDVYFDYRPTTYRGRKGEDVFIPPISNLIARYTLIQPRVFFRLS